MGYLDNDYDQIELKPNVKASFPGGEAKFREYVQREIQYPISCHDQGVNGIVVLRFIIDSKGKISDIKVIEEVKTCPLFTNEVIRILQKSPRWVPGQINGRFIRSLREIDFDISSLKGDEPMNKVGNTIGLPMDYLDNDSNQIELKPNVKASFPGGEAKFREYVQRTFQFPVRCQDYGINGYVVLRFIVDSKGEISDIKVIEETKTCPEFSSEAIRILQKSPRWVPGQVNGRFIKSYREIPIRLSVR
jgi:Na+-translocating ferredoxin:NAD+ oxidoreductase RnfG subunit